MKREAPGMLTSLEACPRPQGTSSSSTLANYSRGLNRLGLSCSDGIPSKDQADLLTMSICPSFIRIRTQTRKANMSLCFSKRLRHTLV